MTYNDPHGDVHEQSGLLGSGRGKLHDDLKSIFGDGVLRHSDFRVDYIDSIKITVTGMEDYEAYVDAYPDLKQAAGKDVNRTKAQWGESHWKEYVNRKMARTTTELRTMKYDRVVKTYTWNAPKETSPGVINSSYDAPVTVPLEFGDTVDFIH